MCVQVVNNWAPCPVKLRDVNNHFPKEIDRKILHLLYKWIFSVPVSNSQLPTKMNADFESVESGAQQKLFSKVKHLVPLCGPMFPYPERPAAVIEVTPECVARVCSYHDMGRGKKEADEWCEKMAFPITHTCCPACEKLVLEDKWEDLREQKQDPANKLILDAHRKFQMARRELAVYCARIDGDTGKLRHIGELTDQELRGALEGL